MTASWRSLLYVPAHVERFVASPRIAEADAVILDLQDGVPPDAKDQARQRMASAATQIRALGPDILVRINETPSEAEADLIACVDAGIGTLVVPQVRSASQVRTLDRRLTKLESDRGLAAGSTRLLILIESAAGLVQMTAISRASRRITAINLGNEDLATDLGVAPTEDALRTPRQLLVIAAVAAGVTPLGLVASGTDFTDLDAYRRLADTSRGLGFQGASCIHPAQIAILNAAFAPTAEELTWASKVSEAAERAASAGQAAFALDGRMIDGPIVARARALIQRQTDLAERQSRRPQTA